MRENVRQQAKEAGWPFPARPADDHTGEPMRAWARLYRRLRWALGCEAERSANVRPGAKLSRLRLAARQRGLEATLTLSEYKTLLAGNACAYCDAVPPDSGHGLDRKDSTKGYTLDNVVLACDACNRIKSDVFSFAQMKEIGDLLRRWRLKGQWHDPQRTASRRVGGRPPLGNLREEIEEWNRLLASRHRSALPTSGGADGGSGR